MKLTEKQVAWLAQITVEGVSKHDLLGGSDGFECEGSSNALRAIVEGRPVRSTPENKALQAAIQAHNDGEADNSPLPHGLLIGTGDYGPGGAHGYRLFGEPLVETAYAALGPSVD